MSWEQYLWAALLVQTAAVDTVGAHGHVLAPVLELARHSSRGATARVVVVEGSVALVALRDLRAGDEVTRCFDPEPDYLDVFERHGFFDGSAAMRTVEVVVPPACLRRPALVAAGHVSDEDGEPVAWRDALVARLASSGCDRELHAWWLPEADVETCPLIAAVRATLVSPEELGWGAAECHHSGTAPTEERLAAAAERLGRPIAAEAATRRWVAELISRHLAAYTSAPEADATELEAAMATTDGVSARPSDRAPLLAALRLLTFEKHLLLELRDALLEAALSDAPPAASPVPQIGQPPLLAAGSLDEGGAAYFINMDSMPHRRRRMEQLLSLHHLKARRVRATTPHDAAFAQLLEEIEWEPAIAERHAANVAPPLRANMLSHAAVWQQVIEREASEPIALVLEDDVMLLKAWRPTVARLLAALPTEWDVLFLDSLPVESEWDFSNGCGVASAVPIRCEPPVLFLDAYLITPAAARWLLARHRQYPSAGGEDLMCDLQKRGRCFHTHPFKVCVQTWHESGISGAGFAATMGDLFATYFRHVPKSLYDDPPLEPAQPPTPAATPLPPPVALPPMVTTTSPNYEPCFRLFTSSLERVGYDTRSLLNTQRLCLRPPFGVGTPSWHEAISKSLSWLLAHMGGDEAEGGEGSEGGSANCDCDGGSGFVIKSDADIQYFRPFARSLPAWIRRMTSRRLDMLCMREAGYEMVNGGFYILRRSARMRRFVRELMRRSRDAPGALHDQEHLNAMLGLADAHSGGGGAAPLSMWDPLVRYEILPEASYVWAQGTSSKDLRTVCFHHAVAEHGVPAKVAQLARVGAEVELQQTLEDERGEHQSSAAAGRLARRLAPLRAAGFASPTVHVGGGAGTGRGARMWLAPYCEEHVATACGWQQAEPALVSLLGLEEADDVDEEAEYVGRVRHGGEPTALLMAVMVAAEGEAAALLVGTAGARFRLPGSFPHAWVGGSAAAAASLAASLAQGDRCPPPLEVEVEIEIERSHRRRGIGSAALNLLLEQLHVALPELACAVAKVPITNLGARCAFLSDAMGFCDARECAALDLVELRRSPLAVRGDWPAYYINLDCRTDRRDLVVASLRHAGLQPRRVAACTPDDPEVQRLAALCPGKAVGWHANAASHAAVWASIAAGDENAPVATAEGATHRARLSFVFEDDVVLHVQWLPMLEATLEAAYRADGQPPELLMLDGLFMAGAAATAADGWLGPPSEGPKRALGVCFSSAYAITPAAASWLLQRRASHPAANAESLLLMLQEKRGRSWTHTPRLALQRWDEAASSVSALSPVAMRKWYDDNYHDRFPRELYV